MVIFLVNRPVFGTGIMTRILLYPVGAQQQKLKIARMLTCSSLSCFPDLKLTTGFIFLHTHPLHYMLEFHTFNNHYSSSSSNAIWTISTWGVFEQLNSWSLGLLQHGQDHSTNAQTVLQAVEGRPRHRQPHSKYAADVLQMGRGP